MAKVRFAAAVGAAAVVAGVSLAGPQATAIATADTSDSGSASDSQTSTGATEGPATRATKPGPRGAAAHGTAPAPPAAAAQRSPSVARSGIEAGTSAVATRVRPAPDSAATAAQQSSTTDTQAPQPVAATVAEVRDAPAAARTVFAPTLVSAEASPVGAVTDSAPAVAVTGAGSTPAVTAAVASPAPPGAVAAVSASATAEANSSAALIDKLLAPISKLFGEGTALLVRRSLFNQAPTVAPIQLTGQSTGPITGTVGAVDLEGDPLTYKITSAPLHGSAVVNPDGSYTYTPGTGFAGTDTFVVDVTDTGRHLNILDLTRPTSTPASVAVAQGAVTAMLRFEFIYGSGSQYWSSAARSALESAANKLASDIVVTSPVTVTFDVTGEKSALSSTLASAGSDFVDGSAGFLQTVVQNKILTGNDANGSAADGTIDWNFGPSWGFSDTVSSSQYDFQSIAMHELLHTFGFMSNIDKAGSNTGHVWTVFDSYVVNQAGTHVINSSNFNWNTAFNSNLTGGNGGLYFGGPDAVAANLSPVALYTPNPWEPGSSMSHLNANYLMKAIVNNGPGIRDVSPVELAILSDIGYTINDGSGTPVLLFVGFIALRLRRRKD